MSSITTAVRRSLKQSLLRLVYFVAGVVYVYFKDFNVHYQIWLLPPYTYQLCELVLNIAILYHLCIHHLILISHGITGTDSSLDAETMAEENFPHFFLAS